LTSNQGAKYNLVVNLPWVLYPNQSSRLSKITEKEPPLHNSMLPICGT